MANILDQITVGDIKVLTVDSDPSASAGTTAPIGSIGSVPSTGALYFKYGAADTNWTLITDASGFTKDVQNIVGALLQATSEIVPTYNSAGAMETFALAPTTVTAGSYGTASSVPTVTFDTKGRATAAVNTPIAITSAQVTDFATAVRTVEKVTLGTATTSTATATPIVTFTAAGTTLLKAFIVGTSSAGDTVAYERSVKVKFASSTATLTIPQSDYTNEDAALIAANVGFTAAGAVVTVNVTGIASTTINWSCTLKAYT